MDLGVKENPSKQFYYTFQPMLIKEAELEIGGGKYKEEGLLLNLNEKRSDGGHSDRHSSLLKEHICQTGENKSHINRKINVNPLTRSGLSQIFNAWTYEYANRYTAMMNDRYSAVTESICKGPFPSCVIILSI